MRLRAIAILTAVGLSVALMPNQVGAAPTRAVQLGSRIESSSVGGGGQARAVVEAPAEQVLAVLTDYARYKDLIPKFTKSQTLRRQGDHTKLRVEAKVGPAGIYSIWADMSMKQSRAADGTHRVEGHLKQGNVKRLDARFIVQPIDEGSSLVTFTVNFDPDLMILSRSMLRDYNVSTARRVLRRLRKRVR